MTRSPNSSLLVLPLSIALGILAPACSKDGKESDVSPTKPGIALSAETPAPTFSDVGPEPTIEQFGPILNYTGRQRMLTQKMAKEVFLVAADVDAANNRKNAGESLATFKKSLIGLRSGDESMRLPPGHYGKVNARLDALSTAFKPFEGLVEKTARGDKLTKLELAQIRDLTDSLLEQEEVIMSILSSAAADIPSAGKTVPVDINVALDISGRQRMFSQKMAKDCILVYLELDTDRHRMELTKTGSLFDKVQNGLRKGDKDIGIRASSDASVLKQLGAVDGLWKDFNDIVARHATAKKKMTRGEVEQIAKLNLPLLTEANKLVESYQRIATGEAPATSGEPTAKK